MIAGATPPRKVERGRRTYLVEDDCMPEQIIPQPDMADVFIGFACTPGQKSCAGELKGSAFIQVHILWF